MTNAALSHEHVLTKETLPTKIGVIFDDQQVAANAASELVRLNEISAAQIKLIGPENDPDEVDEKLAPEDHNIARTLVSTHVWFGAGGVILGSLIALILVLFGPPATSANPLFTFITFIFLCGILGLLAAGVMSLRPDQDALIMKTHSAHARGRWILIVHGHNHEEIGRARATLEKLGGNITATL